MRCLSNSDTRNVDSTESDIIARRLLQALPVLVLATFVVFGLLKLVPGDIADHARRRQRHRRSASRRSAISTASTGRSWCQYGAGCGKAVQGDLSTSLISSEPVLTSIAARFPHTLLIVALAMVVALVIGIPLGIARRQPSGRVLDRRGHDQSPRSASRVPNFWLAMILVALFALRLRLASRPPAPCRSARASAARLHHAILPACALAAGGVAEVSRQLRSVAGRNPVVAAGAHAARQGPERRRRSCGSTA